MFSDDILLGRLWLAPGRSGLAATTHRRYFDPQTGRVDRRPERQIVGDRKPSHPSANSIVERSHAILSSIARRLGGKVEFCGVEQLQPSEPIIDANNEVAFDDHRLNYLYKTHGFDHVPRDWIVSVCPLDGVTVETARNVAGRLERSAHQRAATVQVQLARVEVITEHLLLLGSRAPIPGRVVLFVLPSKRRQPSESTLRLLDSMDAAGVRYRRSYADDPLDYSIPDQLPSILLAAGGRPHRVSTGEEFRDVWSLGIDLSHSRNRPVSTLAYTLISPDGTLSGTWVTQQRRDETVLLPGLMKAVYAIQAHLDDLEASSSPLVIIRDGRLFERESTTAFARTLGNPFLLVEYRKRRNPPAMVLGNPVRHLPGPYAVQIPDTETMFVAPATARADGILPSVAKVTWRSHWNRLDWSARQIASFLIAQTLTPGLGLHRRSLPAALYWADGIAGAGDTDLRFRGNAPVWL